MDFNCSDKSSTRWSSGLGVPLWIISSQNLKYIHSQWKQYNVKLYLNHIFSDILQAFPSGYPDLYEEKIQGRVSLYIHAEQSRWSWSGQISCVFWQRMPKDDIGTILPADMRFKHYLGVTLWHAENWNPFPKINWSWWVVCCARARFNLWSSAKPNTAVLCLLL